ncbi:unnamed protein product [Arctogadus glacialis]
MHALPMSRLVPQQEAHGHSTGGSNKLLLLVSLVLSQTRHRQTQRYTALGLVWSERGPDTGQTQRYTALCLDGERTRHRADPEVHCPGSGRGEDQTQGRPRGTLPWVWTGRGPDTGQTQRYTALCLDGERTRHRADPEVHCPGSGRGEDQTQGRPRGTLPCVWSGQREDQTQGRPRGTLPWVWTGRGPDTGQTQRYTAQCLVLSPTRPRADPEEYCSPMPPPWSVWCFNPGMELCLRQQPLASPLSDCSGVHRPVGQRASLALADGRWFPRSLVPTVAGSYGRWFPRSLVPTVAGSHGRWFLPSLVPTVAGSYGRWFLRSLVPTVAGSYGRWFLRSLVPTVAGSYRRWFLRSLVPTVAGSYGRWFLRSLVPTVAGSYGLACQEMLCNTL